SGVLVTGLVSCQEPPKTGSETTGSNNPTPILPAKPASDATPITDKTTATPIATSSPSPTTTSSATKDLKMEVSKKLKVGIPGNKLEVVNKNGEIIIQGTATSQEEITKAETLAKEVPGVKSVKVDAKVKTEKK
ncbi:MAG: BON domain-containing protein, partial [Sphaerospermopsis kisseleviana]